MDNKKLVESGLNKAILYNFVNPIYWKKAASILSDVYDWVLAFAKVVGKRGIVVQCNKCYERIIVNGETVFLLWPAKKRTVKKQNLEPIKQVLRMLNDDVLSDIKAEYEKIREKKEISVVDSELASRIIRVAKRENVVVDKYAWIDGDWKWIEQIQGKQIDFRGKEIVYSKHFQKFGFLEWVDIDKLFINIFSDEIMVVVGGWLI